MKVWIIFSLIVSLSLIKFFGEKGAFFILFMFVALTAYMEYKNHFRPKM